MPKSSKKETPTRRQRIIAALTRPFTRLANRIAGFMSRRPHRSFRRTLRRDYRRSLKLPGYIAFTIFVNKTLFRFRRTFIWLAVVYAVLTLVLVGLGSQETYVALTDTLRETGAEIFQGNIGQLGQAALLFMTIGSVGLTGSPTEAQQVYTVVTGLLIWLTTVWLLRNLLAGHKVKLRDGLYSAGSPIVATFMVTFVLALQLIPIGIAVIGYSAAAATGLLASGVEAMLFWIAASLLTVLSLYWIVSTFFAMIIVTLPGMYPGKALRTAGDMMVGRRLRILLRLAWLVLMVAAAAVATLVPIILLTLWMTSIWPAVSSVPIVPIALMLFSVVAFIWTTSYIYLLYRRVVDDDAKPA
jgi:hypothetical protein